MTVPGWVDGMDEQTKYRHLFITVTLLFFPTFVTLQTPEDTLHKLQQEIADLQSVIPGSPGKDYPIFNTVPRSSFECQDQQFTGYYADVDLGCQVFHICQDGGKQDSFLCPNGTVFNQQYFVCDWWFNVNCASATQFYALNANIFQEVGSNLREGLEQVLDPSFLRNSVTTNPRFVNQVTPTPAEKFTLAPEPQQSFAPPLTQTVVLSQVNDIKQQDDASTETRFTQIPSTTARNRISTSTRSFQSADIGYGIDSDDVDVPVTTFRPTVTSSIATIGTSPATSTYSPLPTVRPVPTTIWTSTTSIPSSTTPRPITTTLRTTVTTPATVTHSSIKPNIIDDDQQVGYDIDVRANIPISSTTVGSTSSTTVFSSTTPTSTAKAERLQIDNKPRPITVSLSRPIAIQGPPVVQTTAIRPPISQGFIVTGDDVTNKPASLNEVQQPSIQRKPQKFSQPLPAHEDMFPPQQPEQIGLRPDFFHTMSFLPENQPIQQEFISSHHQHAPLPPPPLRPQMIQSHIFSLPPLPTTSPLHEEQNFRQQTSFQQQPPNGQHIQRQPLPQQIRQSQPQFQIQNEQFRQQMEQLSHGPFMELNAVQQQFGPPPPQFREQHVIRRPVLSSPHPPHPTSQAPPINQPFLDPKLIEVSLSTKMPLQSPDAIRVVTPPNLISTDNFRPITNIPFNQQTNIIRQQQQLPTPSPNIRFLSKPQITTPTPLLDIRQFQSSPPPPPLHPAMPIGFAPLPPQLPPPPPVHLIEHSTPVPPPHHHDVIRLTTQSPTLPNIINEAFPLSSPPPQHILNFQMTSPRTQPVRHLEQLRQPIPPQQQIPIQPQHPQQIPIQLQHPQQIPIQQQQIPIQQQQIPIQQQQIPIQPQRQQQIPIQPQHPQQILIQPQRQQQIPIQQQRQQVPIQQQRQQQIQIQQHQQQIPIQQHQQQIPIQQHQQQIPIQQQLQQQIPIQQHQQQIPIQSQRQQQIPIQQQRQQQIPIRPHQQQIPIQSQHQQQIPIQSQHQQPIPVPPQQQPIPFNPIPLHPQQFSNQALPPPQFIVQQPQQQPPNFFHEQRPLQPRPPTQDPSKSNDNFVQRQPMEFRHQPILQHQQELLPQHQLEQKDFRKSIDRPPFQAQPQQSPLGHSLPPLQNIQQQPLLFIAPLPPLVDIRPPSPQPVNQNPPQLMIQQPPPHIVLPNIPQRIQQSTPLPIENQQLFPSSTPSSRPEEIHRPRDPPAQHLQAPLFKEQLRNLPNFPTTTPSELNPLEFIKNDQFQQSTPEPIRHLPENDDLDQRPPNELFKSIEQSQPIQQLPPIFIPPDPPRQLNENLKQVLLDNLPPKEFLKSIDRPHQQQSPHGEHDNNNIIQQQTRSNLEQIRNELQQEKDRQQHQENIRHEQQREEIRQLQHQEEIRQQQHQGNIRHQQHQEQIRHEHDEQVRQKQHQEQVQQRQQEHQEQIRQQEHQEQIRQQEHQEQIRQQDHQEQIRQQDHQEQIRQQDHQEQIRQQDHQEQIRNEHKEQVRQQQHKEQVRQQQHQEQSQKQHQEQFQQQQQQHQEQFQQQQQHREQFQQQQQEQVRQQQQQQVRQQQQEQVRQQHHEQVHQQQSHEEIRHVHQEQVHQQHQEQVHQQQDHELIRHEHHEQVHQQQHQEQIRLEHQEPVRQQQHSEEQIRQQQHPEEPVRQQQHQEQGRHQESLVHHQSNKDHQQNQVHHQQFQINHQQKSIERPHQNRPEPQKEFLKSIDKPQNNFQSNQQNNHHNNAMNQMPPIFIPKTKQKPALVSENNHQINKHNNEENRQQPNNFDQSHQRRPPPPQFFDDADDPDDVDDHEHNDWIMNGPAHDGDEFTNQGRFMSSYASSGGPISDYSSYLPIQRAVTILRYK